MGCCLYDLGFNLNFYSVLRLLLHVCYLGGCASCIKADFDLSGIFKSIVA
jgi:hypothetical protein